MYNNYSNQRILFQCLLLCLWLGGHAHCSWGGGGGGFPAPGLEKTSEKNMLAWHIQLVTCRSQ